MDARDKIALYCLAMSAAAATCGGFAVNIPAGFYSLAASLLLTAWLAGGR